jgi:hypothetical protein
MMNDQSNDGGRDRLAERLPCATLALGLALLHGVDALRGDAAWPAALLGVTGWCLLGIAWCLRPLPLFLPPRQGLERARALARGSDRWTGGLLTAGALCLAASASMGLHAR